MSKAKTEASKPKVFVLAGFRSIKSEFPTVILLLKKLLELLKGADIFTKLPDVFLICNLSPFRLLSPSKAPITRFTFTFPVDIV